MAKDSCPKCGKDTSEKDYYPSQLKKKYAWCKVCLVNNNRKHRPKHKERDKQYNKEYRQKFPDKCRASERNAKLKKAYGISQNDFCRLLESQGNRCKICRESSEKFHVDHDHKTGKVRGLLCNLCNVGLGAFRDNVAYLENAIEYLVD